MPRHRRHHQGRRSLGIQAIGIRPVGEQTEDGYLWLATFGGLARFDGIAFHTFTAAGPSGLGDNRVLALHEDRTGTLWVGTEHNGIFALRDGSFSAPA